MRKIRKTPVAFLVTIVTFLVVRQISALWVRLPTYMIMITANSDFEVQQQQRQQQQSITSSYSSNTPISKNNNNHTRPRADARFMEAQDLQRQQQQGQEEGDDDDGDDTSSSSGSSSSLLHKSDDRRLDALFLINNETTETTTTTARTRNNNNDQLSKSRQDYRLELLHIAKNAGTILELVALQHNITWGACHFEFPWKYGNQNPLRNCPDSLRYKGKNSILNNSLIPNQLTFWHYPLDVLGVQEEEGPPPPHAAATMNLTMDVTYDNLKDSKLRTKPKKFFVVIRNPYDHWISLYHQDYYTKCGLGGPATLNYYIQNIIRDSMPLRPDSPILHRPASHFIYRQQQQQQQHYNNDNDNNNTDQHLKKNNNRDKEIMVDHILHFENLREEFELLIKLYNLPETMTLPTERLRVKKKCSKYMSRLDLTNKTIALINEYYADDFAIGNYTMMMV